MDLHSARQDVVRLEVGVPLRLVQSMNEKWAPKCVRKLRRESDDEE